MIPPFGAIPFHRQLFLILSPMNPIVSSLRIASFAMCFLFAACSREARTPFPAFPILADSVSLERSCMSLSVYCAAVLDNADTNSLGSFYRTLDSSADCLGRSLGAARTSPAAADSIIALVYHQWNIGFDPRDSIPAALLPHLVYKNRKGACLGTGLIILILSERIGCPFYGVALPGHFFLRYDNGATHFNIEPNREGFSHPDHYYRGRYPVASMPWYDLANLTKGKTAGMLCYNAGVLCLKKGRNRPAVSLFAEASRRLPAFAEAKGNLALAYAFTGVLDSSMSVFEKLFTVHPDFVNLAANYGSVAMAAKQYEKARDVFRKGLDYFPEDTVLLNGLAQAHERLDGGKNSSLIPRN
jgi:regulator of sirC expression with transglutaminase-like and TPR domain